MEIILQVLIGESKGANIFYYVWIIHCLHMTAVSQWFSYNLAGGKNIYVSCKLCYHVNYFGLGL